MAKNAYKKEALSEEQIEELQDAVQEKEEVTRNFFRDLLSFNYMSSVTFVRLVPFIGFVGFLAIMYIANRHYAERNIRKIDKISREVKELSWDYKSLSAELMKMTTQSEIAKKAEIIGLKERNTPPMKIIVEQQTKNKQ
jgi:hypothetical protein